MNSALVAKQRAIREGRIAALIGAVIATLLTLPLLFGSEDGNVVVEVPPTGNDLVTEIHAASGAATRPAIMTKALR